MKICTVPVQAFLGMVAFTASTSSVRADPCPLEKVADLPVTLVEGHHPVVTIQIKGQDVHMMVDTGAASSMLTPDAYNRLNLIGTVNANGDYGEGMGGNMQTNTLILQDLAIGEARLKNQMLYVVNFDPSLDHAEPSVDGLMGFDVLQSFDIAFDLPDRRIALYLTPGCSATETPWAGNFAMVPYMPAPYHLLSPYIQIAVNGKPMTVMLDSGADFSTLDRNLLTETGVTPLARASKQSTGYGIGRRAFSFDEEQFSEVDIGAEAFSNMWLAVTGRTFSDNTVLDGVLGEDYLAHHRVFLANTARTAYLGLTMPSRD